MNQSKKIAGWIVCGLSFSLPCFAQHTPSDITVSLDQSVLILKTSEKVFQSPTGDATFQSAASEFYDFLVGPLVKESQWATLKKPKQSGTSRMGVSIQCARRTTFPTQGTSEITTNCVTALNQTGVLDSLNAVPTIPNPFQAVGKVTLENILDIAGQPIAGVTKMVISGDAAHSILDFLKQNGTQGSSDFYCSGTGNNLTCSALFDFNGLAGIAIAQ